MPYTIRQLWLAHAVPGLIPAVWRVGKDNIAGRGENQVVRRIEFSAPEVVEEHRAVELSGRAGESGQRAVID